jgi:dTDP-4-amino-4,6-dideoxygalactose transaminase
MRLVYETRASTILYNVVRSGGADRPWLLPANVCPIVPLTFLKAGCPFELVDIEEATLCIDRDVVLHRLRAAPGAYGGVLFVRTFGVEDDFVPFFAEIKEHAGKLILVDDRCLCRPRFEISPEGPADVVVYSTGYAKPVDVGSGGFAYIDDGVAYKRHRTPYHEEDLERLTVDYKAAVQNGLRLGDADGAWLDTREPGLRLDEYRTLIERCANESYELKHRINAIYRTGIPSFARLEDRFQAWRFHVLVEDKQALLEAIFANGLFASSHYADLTPVFANGRALVAEKLHRRVVNLFNDRYFTEEKAGRIVALVRAHLEARGS